MFDVGCWLLVVGCWLLVVEISMFRQAFHELTIATCGRGLVEFTDAVEQWIAENKFRDGLITLHLRHTSASLLIQ